MKTSTETFASADMKDVSGLLDGLCSEQEKDFVLGEAVAAVTDLASETPVFTRTAFSGSLPEFIEFCDGYGVTDNCIMVARPSHAMKLLKVDQAMQAGLAKCDPEARIFNAVSMDSGFRDFAAMFFRKG